LIKLFGPNNIEITLPAYMNSLTQEEISIVLCSKDQEAIIACGFHKDSNTLMLVTKNAELLEIDPDSFFKQQLNLLSAKPIEAGHKIEISIQESIIEVDSEDAIGAARRLDLSNVRIDM
jgi:hypothetical protein